MNLYRMLVYETGCVQPVELIAQMASDGRAVDFARQRLTDYSRIQVIEVWSGLCRLSRLQRRNVEAGAPVPSGRVELGIVAKDALLVESDAPRGLQIAGDARAPLDALGQRQDRAELGLQ
jgi:hypothetical protein